MNIFVRFKRFICQDDLKDRLSSLESQVYHKPDLIGFERIEADEIAQAWDDSNEVYPMHWEEDNAKKI